MVTITSFKADFFFSISPSPKKMEDLWAECMFIQLFQFTLLDQSFKGTIVLGDIHKAAATSSTWNPNISFIQMARHRRSSLYGRGIVNFADNYSLRSHIPLRSCLVGLRLWSDNVNWNSCMYLKGKHLKCVLWHSLQWPIYIINSVDKTLIICL